MATRQRKNSNLHRLVIPVFCLTLSAYFYYHSTIGKFGLESHRQTVERSLELEFRLASLRQDREELEKRVMLLKNGSIERDMLDEQARYNLNLLHGDEIVLMR
ncbi:MAG: septum formation initiator family protein [Rhizobiaceae bacterium]|nr:septum formation initiator family protein [Rhizobiaceae bacterium]